VNKKEAHDFMHRVLNDVIDIVFQTCKTVTATDLLSLSIWIMTELMNEKGVTDD